MNYLLFFFFLSVFQTACEQHSGFLTVLQLKILADSFLQVNPGQ